MTDKDSNLPNNGEILVLPLFSLIYLVEQADDIDNAKEKEVLEEDDDFDTGTIHVLTRILKVPLNHAKAQTLRNDTVFGYIEFKYHGDDDINWVYEYKSISKQDTVALRAVNAYALYLSGNGNDEMARDPTLWDVDAFNKWKRNDCVTFLANEVPLYIPPKLKNFDPNINDRSSVPKKKMEKKKKLIVTTTPSPFHAGITYTLTNLLELPFTHSVALALQHDVQFKVLDEKYKGCECFELLSLDLNAVFLFRYPTANSNNTTVMKVLPERKARSLQGILAYYSYLYHNNDDTCDDLTQWDVTVFKKWRRASCLAYIASRKPYNRPREVLGEWYNYYEKSTEAISEK